MIFSVHVLCGWITLILIKIPHKTDFQIQDFASGLRKYLVIVPSFNLLRFICEEVHEPEIAGSISITLKATILSRETNGKSVKRFT